MATVCNFPVEGTASFNNFLQLLQICEPLIKIGFSLSILNLCTGWGVNFSFGQEGGGGGVGQNILYDVGGGF